jgi:hypothetical protein
MENNKKVKFDLRLHKKPRSGAISKKDDILTAYYFENDVLIFSEIATKSEFDSLHDRMKLHTFKTSLINMH